MSDFTHSSLEKFIVLPKKSGSSEILSASTDQKDAQNSEKVPWRRRENNKEGMWHISYVKCYFYYLLLLREGHQNG